LESIATVLVYQAFRPSIGKFALEHGIFGGPDFSFSRMSWIKPNFLWIMYRSGWGTKEGQETTLAVRLSREFFELILARRRAFERPWSASTYRAASKLVNTFASTSHLIRPN
jgi:Domain of unknown function (DUF4291)